MFSYAEKRGAVNLYAEISWQSLVDFCLCQISHDIDTFKMKAPYVFDIQKINPMRSVCLNRELRSSGYMKL